MNLALKVHVATKYSSGTCYAYVAYDQSCAGSDSATHMRAHFTVVNITSETSPYVYADYISSACGTGTDNDFESISTANYFTNNVGWFYYHQPSADACNTTFNGQVSTSLGLFGMTSLGALGSAFPTIEFTYGGVGGLGDYVGIIKRGLPGGALYPTWSQPVSAPSCVSCRGSSYALGLYAAEITF